MPSLPFFHLSLPVASCQPASTEFCLVVENQLLLTVASSLYKVRKKSLYSIWAGQGWAGLGWFLHDVVNCRSVGLELPLLDLV